MVLVVVCGVATVRCLCAVKSFFENELFVSLLFVVWPLLVGVVCRLLPLFVDVCCF